MATFVLKIRVKAKSLLNTGTSLLSSAVVACLLGSLLVALPSSLNVANASITATNLTNIPTVTSANGIAASDDGTKLVLITGHARDNNGAYNAVYTSSDSGATWTLRTIPALSTALTVVVSSSTGQYLLVTTRNSKAAITSNDYGVTWTTRSFASINTGCNNELGTAASGSGGTSEHHGVAMSSDGSVVVIQTFNSYCMLISKDYGATFSKVTSPTYMMYNVDAHLVQSTVTPTSYSLWFAKGEEIVGNGGLWRYDFSTTGAVTSGTWTTTDYRATYGDPKAVTGSRDGTIVYLAGDGKNTNYPYTGPIKKSTNSGATFTTISGTSKNWMGLKSDSTGTKLIGWDTLNYIYMSVDGGATWTTQVNPTLLITSAVFSGDGSVAYMSAGDMFMTQTSSKVYKFTLPLTAPAFTLSSSSETASVSTAVSGYTIRATGGRVEQYSISPSLSAGLNFNPSTGLISGTPTAKALSTVYTITGTNSLGSATATFTLRVSSCAQGGKCLVGDRGPGGGSVFYVSTGSFACGVDLLATCKYLEAAPALWNGGSSDPTISWAQSTPVNYQSAQVLNATEPKTANLTDIGGGYRNTRAIILQGNSNKTTSAAALADDYSPIVNGVVVDDWYLASTGELRQMCKWQRGRAWVSDATECNNPWDATNTNNTGPGAAGFSTPFYWASTQAGANTAHRQFFADGNPSTEAKSRANDMGVRPIRAFAPVKVNGPTTFSASLATPFLGQTDTLTATIEAEATGIVTFKDGSGNILCTTGSLNILGMASCAWTPAGPGNVAVTAYYEGDAFYNPTTSNSTTIQVLGAFTITYNVNLGVGTAPDQGSYSGTAFSLPAGTGLTRSGYNFGGWSLTETGTALTSPYSPSSTCTLYAVWTPRQYTITYNSNGGTGSQSTGSYTTDAVATTLPATSTFSRLGYLFGGWATSAGSTTPVTSYSTSADANFYAIWTRGSFNVRFLANGATGSMETQTSSAAANLTANSFTFADRTFTGWNTSADGTGVAYSDSQSYPFLTNLTLYARWGNIITFTSQGATSGSPSRTSEGWVSGAINLPTIGTMVKAGYTFSGWNTGTQTYAGGASYTPTAGITLNPVWTANTYTISYNSNQATGGSVPSSQNWTTGTTALTLPGNSRTLVKAGYTFGGWASSVSSTTPVTSYSTSANKIFYAIWTPIDYTFTYVLNGGTSTVPTQASLRIYNSFTLAATPTRANFNFAGWSNGSTTYGALATYSITAGTSASTTLTAQWTPVYTLSYVLNGSPSVVTGGGLYESGTVLALAAAPTFTGYNFGGWLDSSGNTRAAETNFTIVENSTLQARWTAIPYSVTYNLGGGSGTLPLQSSLTIGQSFLVAPTPSRAGYVFDGWNNGSETYTAGSTYVIGSSNVTLTAQWTVIPYMVTFDLGGGAGTLPTQADGTIGTTFSLPASGSNPTRLAHTFTGWSDGSALYAPGATYTFGVADVTLTAQFSQNGYTKITYSLGSGAGIAPIQASVLEGTTITIASGALVTRANYAFAGWSDGANVYAPGVSYVVGPESAPITFVPNWTSGYNVSYSTGSGFGTAPVDPVGRIPGSTFTVASAATVSRQGFTFTGWSDGSRVVAPGATYTVASSNITLTAQWVQNSLAGIPSNALTPLASFSIVNGVGPIGGFNFGSSSVSYEIPVNALSAGTVISIYGLTDFSSLAGIVPSGKTVISSTVISWLGTDGTVQDTNSPIKMTITDSQIIPGSVVYAVTGGELTLLGTATTNGSITTTIVSDPVILIANPMTARAPAPVVVDNSAALAAATAKEVADKKAAEEAAALKAATEAKAAEAAAALKAAQEKMAADAKALAEAKAAADAAAIKEAQDAADASAKAAAALQAAKDAEIAAANAAQAIKPAVTLYSLSSTLKLSAYDSAYLTKYVKSLKNGASVTCIGYSYSKNTTLKKATALAKSQATAVCALMKKTNKTLKTSVVVYPATKAPKAAMGAKWVGVSYRIDGFKN